VAGGSLAAIVAEVDVLDPRYEHVAG
jgi:hypothetical protein